MFVLVSRLDKMSTTGLSENKELNNAAESVIAKISQELASDIPRTDPNGIVLSEYYDYPGPADIWLACLEPYVDAGDYYWRQISDIYGVLDANYLQAEIVDDYQSSINQGLNADADGDGVADSAWVKMPDITSSKGKPIYAAVRIIDNSGMLNVNTAYKFDPTDTEPNLIDGSSQMQINLMALSWHPSIDFYDANDEMDLLYARNPLGLIWYERDAIWHYGDPNGPYTPFDISDELELRYRFLLNHTDIDTRLEDWGGEFRTATSWTPFKDKDDWFISAYDNGSLDPNYAYRHLATTYNMDRSINPRGIELNNGKMVNINRDDVDSLYDAIYAGLYDANLVSSEIAAQMAVNIKDYADTDPNVTVYNGYYGFEAQPFISEIGFWIHPSIPIPLANNYFALELYNPFDVNIPLNGFRLELRLLGALRYKVNLAGSITANSRFVITNSAAASTAFGIPANQVDPNLILATYTTDTTPGTYKLSERYNIYLLRTPNLYLDQQNTQNIWFNWTLYKGSKQYYYRPDNNWNIMYQAFVHDLSSKGSLGQPNGGGTKTNYNIPKFKGGFTTVGDIARVLTIGPSTDPCDMIGVQLATEPPEESVRLNLADPNFQQLFNYLTVFPPEEYVSDSNETRIKGRININTAPWFVLAQLPWVTNPTLAADDPNRYKLAETIAAYRDDIVEGFRSIGELNQLNDSIIADPNCSFDYYARDTNDLDTFPDLTFGDNAINDFEERDVIFSRISNLVTVRSDVFTAYILVRIGEDGPQKRVMAILDRSNVYSPKDKVKIVALYPVPDPR
jgi:DNA uptake protein ComE-like DNA-binding protein